MANTQGLQDVKLFLLDMDGTFFLGDKLLPGALAFLAQCRGRGVRYCFLTNNSSKSAEAYVEKLNGLGANVARDEVFTSGDATIEYLAQQGLRERLLLIGTPSLEQSFRAAGYTLTAEKAGAVVLGFDTTLTYEKLCALCAAVRSGLPYIATHPDFNCPVPGGYIPDIGATIAYVEASTGRRPDAVIGKPNAAIAQAAATRFGLPLEALCIVGDRLYTDIALGPAAGIRSVLVLSGETDASMLQNSAIQPDYVFSGLAGLAAALGREG